MALGTTPSTNPGWANAILQFWAGKRAGVGPSAVPAPLSATGGDSSAQGNGGSVDAQTYPFTVNATIPTLIVGRQPTRSSLTIQNNSNATIFVYFGPQSQNTVNLNTGLKINSGDPPYQPKTGIPVDEIYIATSGVSASGVIITGT